MILGVPERGWKQESTCPLGVNAAPQVSVKEDQSRRKHLVPDYCHTALLFLVLASHENHLILKSLTPSPHQQIMKSEIVDMEVRHE